MTTMNSELYNALKNAGVSEKDARAAAESVAHGGEVATKTDLAELETRLIKWIVGVGIAIVVAGVFG